MDLEAFGLDSGNSVQLMGPAGSISIHNARIIYSLDLNTSPKDWRVIFYETMAADAFPIVGGCGTWEGIEEFDQRLLCGQSTLEPRMESSSLSVAAPDAPTQGSIYEVQKAMGKRAFTIANRKMKMSNRQRFFACLVR